ncbi:hypothetical protein [Flavobacterium hydrophilum]|uniref:DUF4595 domain-containing protein n=1 Tax=Flavobacterium hydrophilum TaxID=2211445 RepID=A0A2V4BX70_9FLAO|nr:hypothetical protein [Flavobacterium hydrophilum]PXY43611.1 hypothetical protein DMB68_18675 [Flavobacterium hydrophilum]
MKHLLTLLFLLTTLFQGYSQQKGKKKPISKAKTTAVQEAPMAAPTIEKIIPDTLQIKKGKKYIFLVDVNEYSSLGNTVYAGNDDNSEKTELKRNFPKENLEIINITKYTYVLFENKQTLDITGQGQSFQAFAYWSGKLDDKVQVKEGTRMATEFVAEQLKSKKESSYVVNTKKYRKEVASLQGKNKITSKSKEVIKVLLSEHSLPIPDIKLDDEAIFKQGTAKLKTLDSYFLKKKGIRIPLKSVSFNNEGLPTAITYYDDEGKNRSKKEFIYKDGVLTKIIKEDQTTSSINYDDNKVIFTANIGDANETTVYWLENGKLLQKSYTLMADDKFSYMNTFTEEKYENNCISYYINNVVWSNNCGGTENKFPFIHTYTSYQDKEVLQYRKSKIEKKDNRTFEKYYSAAERADQNDDYKLFGTIHLDDFNLVDSYSFTKDNEAKTIKVDYTCYE